MLGSTFLDVAVFDGLIDALIGAVSVALVKVFLIGVVGLIADDDRDGAIAWVLNAGGVLRTHREPIKLVSRCTVMIKCIHQANIFKLLVASHFLADR